MPASDNEWTIVPAAAGQVAHMIFVANRVRRPVEADMYSYVYQVCAWRVHHDGLEAEPVFPERVASNALILIELPDKRLLSPNDEHFTSLQQAKIEILERAQSVWDRKNNPPTT